MAGKPRVGISACLLGQKVRWDGGHKQEPYLKSSLARYVEWVAVCPEKECGLPVPRSPMELKGDPEAPRLVAIESGEDYTERMRRWADKRLKELQDFGLCAFVFKAGSPSCALRGVKIRPFKGGQSRCGSGVFARAFTRRFPLLPVMSDEDLSDVSVRESFVERMFVSRRWIDLLAEGAPLEGLRRFHVAHELLIAAHDPARPASLDRLISRAQNMPRYRLLEKYGSALVAALDREATPKKNAHVLLGVVRRLQDGLSFAETTYLREVIDEYRAGDVPLLVPIVLVKHYMKRISDDYLSRQFYFDPYPAELGLRARNGTRARAPARGS